MAYNYSQFQPGYYQGNGNGYPQQNPYYPTAVNTQQYSGGGMQTAAPMAQMQQPMSQQSASSGINWVQGRAGANSFYVAPGQSALLMDSEDSVLYVKSVDMTGRPTGCCAHVSVENVSTGATATAAAPAINVQNANLVVTRTA